MAWGHLWEPGAPPRMHTPLEHYDLRQRALWEILADMAVASRYGFAHTRHATPGTRIPLEGAREWARGVCEEWEREAQLRQGYGTLVAPQKRGIREEDLPQEAWLHYYERRRWLP